MYKVQSFCYYQNREDDLAHQIEDYLNSNHVPRQNIVDIKYFTEKGYLYCMLIWEDN